MPRNPKKPDPHKLMRVAVKVMRESQAEPRTDGKTSPKVGAVLLKPDGTIETACRGELRHGDHAEFTLLERKNRDQKLDGCILFATLEPCAPDSRHPPKMSCAERIVLARIKEVWVGLEDPDPTVDRKGIKFMQDAGITVHMFDRDLQEEIQVENREFLKQALERAASLKAEVAKKPVLSMLEDRIDATALEDLSTNALQEYRARARLSDEVGSSQFNRRLVQLGLLTRTNGQFNPTGFGVLLFGKEPRVSMPQSGLLATIHYPDDAEEIRDFDGPQVLVPELALKWLRDKLPNLIDRSGAQRKGKDDLLFELVREAIVNAIVHRDYAITGAKCQMTVTADTIEVRSPGGPIEPITLKQMQSFAAPMLSRNPVLHYVFACMELAEERGLGLISMKRRAEQAGLPLPKYSWDDPYLALTLYRSQTAVISTLPEDVSEALVEAERAGWQWLMSKGQAKSKQYAEAMEVDQRTARRHLNRFVELGLARKTGSARATEYEVI